MPKEQNKLRFQRFTIAFGAFVVTTALLYGIGHIFTISVFMLHHEYTDSANGFFVATGSVVPFIIGLIMSFLAEKLYMYKMQI